MFDLIQSKLPGPPLFLLCILAERKNSDVYGTAFLTFFDSLFFPLECKCVTLHIPSLKFSGPWKKKNLVDLGIVTQCIAPTRVNDQYLTNVLLKINAKVISENCYFNQLESKD